MRERTILLIAGVGGVFLLISALASLMLEGGLYKDILSGISCVLGVFLVWMGLFRLPMYANQANFDREKEPPVRVKATGVEKIDLPQTDHKSTDGEAETVQLLILLQEKGRLIDFLMDDVTDYPDEQVGAAARILHIGCRSVLDEFIELETIRNEQEGSMIKLSADFTPSDYRLSGDLTNASNRKGKLLHHGWRVKKLKLPRLSRQESGRWPALSQAQVDLT